METNRENGKGAPRRPMLVTLILLCALPVVSLNMFLPSLPAMAADFGAPYALVTLAVAGYAAVTALLQLIVGPLSDRFGRRPVILAGVTVFCLASAGCLLSTHIVPFLVFRMVQASIVAGYTVSLAVIRDVSGARQAAGLMGYIAMAYAVGPMLAPVLGGVLDGAFGWRASFWAFLGIGLVLLGLCWVDLSETNRAPSKTVLGQFLAYRELIGSRRFWGYALCMAFSTGGFYAFLTGAPLVATSRFGISTAELGFYIGSITCGFVLGSFLAGRLAARHALTAMMIAGRLVASMGLLSGLAALAAGIADPLVYFGACIFYGVGNGVTLPSSIAGAMSVRPGLTGSASGLAGALAVAGGALTAAVTGAVLTEQNAAHGLLLMMLLAAGLGLAAALYVLFRVPEPERPGSAQRLS